jgi:hypothetical protein
MADRRITVRPKTLIHPPSKNVFKQCQSATLAITPGIRRLENISLVDMKVNMRQAPEIRHIVNVYWQLLPKNEHGRISKDTFQEVGLRIFKLISKDKRDAQNSKLVEGAWASFDHQELDYG